MERLSPSYKTFAKQSHIYIYIHIYTRTHTLFFKIAPKINHMTTKKKETQNSWLRGMPEYSCLAALSIKLHVTTGKKKQNS